MCDMMCDSSGIILLTRGQRKSRRVHLSFGLSFTFCLQNIYHLSVDFSVACCLKCSFEGVKIRKVGASLVAQWLRILLPMQGTRVQALVWEDPTCRGATKPVHHNYWPCALEPMSHNYEARMPQLLKPACLEPVLCNKRSQRNGKPAHHNEG